MASCMAAPLWIRLIPRRVRKQHADEAEDTAHGELAEDEAEEERQRTPVEAHPAEAQQKQLRGPAEEDAEPHPVDRAPREADRVADRVQRPPDEPHPQGAQQPRGQEAGPAERLPQRTWL